MRIISGKYKYKRLNEFNVPTTRPTSDKVKEALFDILGEMNEKICLDLFAGTGALGLEAISRGAKKSFFVEENINIYKILVKNFKEVGVKESEINALRCDFKKALKSYKSKDMKFDIIFIDPPYKTNYAEIAIKFILENQLLNEDGVICWEHDKTKLDLVNEYNVFNHKKYGQTYITLIKEWL